MHVVNLSLFTSRPNQSRPLSQNFQNARAFLSKWRVQKRIRDLKGRNINIWRCASTKKVTWMRLVSLVAAPLKFRRLDALSGLSSVGWWSFRRIQLFALWHLCCLQKIRSKVRLLWTKNDWLPYYVFVTRTELIDLKCWTFERGMWKFV